MRTMTASSLAIRGLVQGPSGGNWRTHASGLRP
jgi:hypothetical protein